MAADTISGGHLQRSCSRGSILRTMRILVSNDDGIFSPGIRVLANAAKEFGDVRVVAPDVEQSAMSHAITIKRPLHYHPVPLDDIEAYRVDGTPADCVALGAYHWEDRKSTRLNSSHVASSYAVS